MYSKAIFFILRILILCYPLFIENSYADATIQPWHVHNLAKTKCVEGLERFVPAQVYLCLAIKSYGLKEYEATNRFLDQSALWGSKQADYVMGYMALTGDHQSRNVSKALAWYSLAAERHTEFFQKAYDDLRNHATPDELARAQAILNSLGPKYTDAVAAVRAEERYHEGMNWLDSKKADSNICISGMITPRGAVGSANPAIAGHCPTPLQLDNEVNTFAAVIFEGWRGHVDVGQLQQVRIIDSHDHSSK